MSRMARSLAAGTVALVLVTAPAGLRALEPEKQKTQAPAQIEVGDTAPDFALPDPDDTDHKLSDLQGKKNGLLVFFRGAW